MKPNRQCNLSELMDQMIRDIKQPSDGCKERLESTRAELDRREREEYLAPRGDSRSHDVCANGAACCRHATGGTVHDQRTKTKTIELKCCWCGQRVDRFVSWTDGHEVPHGPHLLMPEALMEVVAMVIWSKVQAPAAEPWHAVVESTRSIFKEAARAAIATVGSGADITFNKDYTGLSVRLADAERARDNMSAESQRLREELARWHEIARIVEREREVESGAASYRAWWEMSNDITGSIEFIKSVIRREMVTIEQRLAVVEGNTACAKHQARIPLDRLGCFVCRTEWSLCEESFPVERSMPPVVCAGKLPDGRLCVVPTPRGECLAIHADEMERVYEIRDAISSLSGRELITGRSLADEMAKSMYGKSKRWHLEDEAKRAKAPVVQATDFARAKPGEQWCRFHAEECRLYGDTKTRCASCMVEAFHCRATGDLCPLGDFHVGDRFEYYDQQKNRRRAVVVSFEYKGPPESSLMANVKDETELAGTMWQLRSDTPARLVPTLGDEQREPSPQQPVTSEWIKLSELEPGDVFEYYDNAGALRSAMRLSALRLNGSVHVVQCGNAEGLCEWDSTLSVRPMRLAPR